MGVQSVSGGIGGQEGYARGMAGGEGEECGVGD